jgi:hypothetical protein
MKSNSIRNHKGSSGERGAALIVALLATILLLTASAFLLSSVGNQSRNNSDVLSETKAYYAAESGLQSTINLLRNKSVPYSLAVAHPTLSYDAATFTQGLTYAADTDGVQKVTIASESKYKVQVYDPDAGKPYTFSTSGSFKAGAGATADNSDPLTPKICFPDCSTVPRTELTYHRVGATNADFVSNPPLGNFTTNYVSGGVTVPIGSTFRIEFIMTSPRDGSRTIRGTINKASSTGVGVPVQLTFEPEVYTLLGSTIEMCSVSTSPNPTTVDNNCPNISPLLVGSSAVSVLADISPVEPYRLVVRSTGYGGNGSQKQLEGIVQMNFFDDLASSSPIALIGPSAGMVFDAGTGGPVYCGVDLGYKPGDPIPNTPNCTIDPNVPTAPSIGVTDPNALGTVTSGGSKATMSPPPDYITDVPDWQSSPQGMDNFVRQYRFQAQNSGTYYGSVGGNTSFGNSSPAIGDYAHGTGVTFCEGNCSVGPINGGGILIVTGTFTYNGNFSFNGLIVVTGPGGMNRSGGGGGQIVGNVVVAPYDPTNLAGGFLPPHFTTNGGGNSDILFGGTSSAFNGTQAVTNLMLGVAEK